MDYISKVTSKWTKNENLTPKIDQITTAYVCEPHTIHSTILHVTIILPQYVQLTSYSMLIKSTSSSSYQMRKKSYMQRYSEYLKVKVYRSQCYSVAWQCMHVKGPKLHVIQYTHLTHIIHE